MINLTPIDISYKERGETVKNMGFWQVLLIHMAYLLALFITILALAAILSLIIPDMTSSTFQIGVIIISLLVALGDPYLLKCGNITIGAFLVLMMMSPILVIYKVFNNRDLLILDRSQTPAALQRYIFPRRGCIHPF